jgi:metal-responsive CopG/Arc/MetJ family transcriptional regulator
METKAIRLPNELARAVDQIAEERQMTRSDIIREAIVRYCEAHASGQHSDRVRLLDRLVTYPGSGIRDLGSKSEHHLRRMFRERSARSR